MNVALTLLLKDLATEWRSRDRIVAMTVFSFLVVVVFQFAWPPMEPAEVVRFAPGILWVTYVFAAVIGIGRTFAMELENDAMTALALAPGTRGWIFLPGQIFILKAHLKPGPQVLTMRFLGQDGAVIDEKTLDLDMAPNRVEFVSVRSFR